jgi:integrase
MVGYARSKRLRDGSVRWYAVYLGLDGRYHEQGGHDSKRAAAKAAATLEVDARRGQWSSPELGRFTFGGYVSRLYWPTTTHLEVSTRAAYRYYLNKHFLPRFGQMTMRRISSTMVQAWVNDMASSGTLSNRSIVKYHALLHRIFARAVVDRAVPINPCANTQLPKIVTRPKRIVTPAQFDRILEHVPPRYRTMVLVAIETGLRWGELIALRPIDIDPRADVIAVHRTIVEVSARNSPTGDRYLIKDHPKSDRARYVSIEHGTTLRLIEHANEYGVSDDGLLFSTTAGTALSRNNFRTKYWRPAVEQANLVENITFHQLRAAHASWLLAGGADLQVVKERLGHRQITTTQQYLGTLPDAGERALAAFRRTREGQ